MAWRWFGLWMVRRPLVASIVISGVFAMTLSLSLFFYLGRTWIVLAIVLPVSWLVGSDLSYNSLQPSWFARWQEHHSKTQT